DPGLKQFPILRSLTNKENTAEQDRQREPAEHRGASLSSQPDLSPPKSETAREKTNAEHQRPRNIQFFRSRTGLWPRVEIQIGKDKRREESCFGLNEAYVAQLVMIGKGYRSVILAYVRVRPVRICMDTHCLESVDRV